jgi:hypothetical protein
MKVFAPGLSAPSKGTTRTRIAPSSVGPVGTTGKNRTPHGALDLLLVQCRHHGNGAWHSVEKERSRAKPRRVPTDRQIMRHFCVAISYSQQALSSKVGRLIETAAFRDAFCAFDPAPIVARGHAQILKRHWSQLTCIRFRGKVKSIVGCARVLRRISREHGSFATYLTGFHLPRRLTSPDDINLFWVGFDRLQSDLQRRRMPFFRSTTTLLQLLLDLDFDSIKPDLIVMCLARRLGIAKRETGDPAFRSAVKDFQQFAVTRRIRAPLVDAAVLAYGGQKEAATWLDRKPCPPSDPCADKSCRLWQNRLCLARK